MSESRFPRPRRGWRLASMHVFQVSSPRDVLVGLVLPAPGVGWAASCVSSPRPPDVLLRMPAERAVSASVDRIFDNHSHQNLGAFPKLVRAQRAVEAFAKKWLAGERRALRRCACGPIVPKKTKRARPRVR